LIAYFIERAKIQFAVTISKSNGFDYPLISAAVQKY
jgi:hypothetical protein